MEAHEYDSVEELKGSLNQKNCPDPAAFERAQYLRGLSSSWRTMPDLISNLRLSSDRIWSETGFRVDEICDIRNAASLREMVGSLMINRRAMLIKGYKYEWI